MSLINEMLKDLESRKGVNASQGVPYTDLNSNIQRRPTIPVWLIVALLVAALLVGLAAWRMINKSSADDIKVSENQSTVEPVVEKRVVEPEPLAEPEQAKAEVVKTETVAKAPAKIIPLVQATRVAPELPINKPELKRTEPKVVHERLAGLSSIAVESKDEWSRLKFSFNKRVDYRLVSAREGKEWRLIIEKAELKSVPPPPTDLGVVSQLDIEHKDRRLEVVMQGAVPLKASSSSARSAANNVVVLDFVADSNPEPVVVAVAEKHKVAKVPEPKPHATVEKRAVVLSRDEQAEQYYQQAVDTLERGEIAESESILRKTLSYSAKHRGARESLSMLMINANRLREAGDILIDGIALDGEYLNYRELYARLLVAERQVDRALHILKRDLNEKTLHSDQDYLALIAALEQQLEQHVDAASHYQALVDQQPGRGLWWMGLAISQESLDQFDSALQSYRNAAGSGNLPTNVVDYVNGRIGALD
ncbi:hypothetical protein BOW53_10720 [Solemya pervernicosa gill symbiont]|uniref:Uncharacterized protein n=2 Tax=Gammaproteobacteria incertae sedis TaxID=118884 RepID=A0A1T2L3G8_9GAMM|nr:hypothetical protein [Candidatus Reidiella endopervernicosa]OOZ39609.1 hypothetical protein BOW53_10720 [Solemya pervernicosa gill symbiont]QKQ25461.1 hypothetical protein HUE57_03470 [Candidatus Reidiella endopervernicosa]